MYKIGDECIFRAGSRKCWEPYDGIRVGKMVKILAVRDMKTTRYSVNTLRKPALTAEQKRQVEEMLICRSTGRRRRQASARTRVRRFGETTWMKMR